MCKKEEVRILTSSYDDVCSTAIGEISHLKFSSEVFIQSNKYNIFCGYIKDFLYGEKEKIAYCKYKYNDNFDISIIFCDDDIYYSYFNQDIEYKDIVEIVSGSKTISNIINKSQYRYGKYYKYANIDNKDPKNDLFYKLLKLCKEEGLNDDIVEPMRRKIKVLMRFFENNLFSFSETTQLVNFIFYFKLFLKDDKPYNFYAKTLDIGNFDLTENFEFLDKTIKDIVNESVKNNSKNLKKFFEVLEKAKIDDEQKKYAKYFINCLMATISQVLNNDDLSEQEEVFKYIQETLFSA